MVCFSTKVTYAFLPLETNEKWTELNTLSLNVDFIYYIIDLIKVWMVSLWSGTWIATTVSLTDELIM